MSARVTRHPERRVRGLFLAILVVLTVFAAQLVRLQGLDAGGMAAKGARQRLVDEPVPAARGTITDSQGVVLADSLERYTLVVDQQAIATYKKKVNGATQLVGARGAAADIAPLLKIDAAELEPRLTGTKRYNRVATDVTPVAWRAITGKRIPGLAVERTVRRTYPQGPATASVVGVLTNDGRPAGGVEAMLDAELKGIPGKQTYEQTVTGRRIPTADSSFVKPVPGKAVRLTVDADVTWFAQNALARAVQKYKALSGNIVVQDVRTGRLVAVANYPTFDPADLRTLSDGGRLGNLAFQDVFEPGSTAKVITIAAAMQEGLVSPGTPITTPNRLTRADEPFRDSHDHATLHLTTAGVVAQSSNIGTILIGERMPSQTYLRYAGAFGLGHPTGVGFPGESAGLVPKKVGDTQRYTMLFGQGLSVNAVQAASVFQTIANGGTRIAPTLVEGTTDADGAYTPAPAPQATRVVSEQTARSMSRMLESVVSGEGTAKAAAVPGYLVAGKTGTANRYDDVLKKYDGYTASFVGYAPADAPRYVVGVTLQRPLAGEYGGVVAAPLFSEVMKYLLQRYSVAPSGAAPANLPLTTDGSDPATGSPARAEDVPTSTSRSTSAATSTATSTPTSGGPADPTATPAADPSSGASASSSASDPGQASSPSTAPDATTPSSSTSPSTR